MSRTSLMLFLFWVVACSDQNSMMAPETPEALPPGEDRSDIELDFSSADFNRAHTALSGGATTVFDATLDAFSFPAANISNSALHDEGDEGFEDAFGVGPAAEHPGLGSVFDNVSCEACHVGDGRAGPPNGQPFDQHDGMLFRSSVTGFGPHGGPRPVPGFGGQLQLRAITGFVAEVRAMVQYFEREGRFADGARYRLQVPQYTLTGLYRSLPAGLLFSPRVGPAVFGLGLLEAVPELALLANGQASSRTHPGISGRANYVWDERRQRTVVGRFGWKANAPNLVQQAAGAYNGDMGVTSTLFPAESCEGRPGCERHPAEVDDETVAAVAFYTQTLAVPARRDLDNPTTDRGERLFYASGCDGCHTPTLRTGSLRGVPEVSNQVIHPYTDLLLHDMGPALADGRPDFRASGSEWRTPPLWGIGLVSVVNGHTNFMHDGRARSLLEAVLWHGGEAKPARDRVLRLSAPDRQALVAFLSSL
ncbi:MAG TPA: di-heme oxidoredictase family protein [Gemmatimonadales bacterium]